MALGLLLQGSGLAWLAAVVEPGIGYGTLVTPLIISGIGIALCLPTVANAVVESVPLDDAGVAAGVNTSLRELGGVFGIALMAAVWAESGGYSSPAAFIDGFVPAITIAAVVPLPGLIATLIPASRRHVASQS